VKKLLSYTYLIYRIYLPIVVILAVAAIFLTQYVSYALSLCYFFLALVLSLVLTHAGKLQLGTVRKNFLRAQYQIFAIQIAFLLVFFAICNAYISFIPIPSDRAGISTATAWQVTLSETLKWGLFPWSASSLTAIAMAYLHQTEKNSINLLNTLSLSLRRPRQGILGLGAELFIRQGLIFFAGITLGAISLTGYFWLCQFFHMKTIFGTNFATLLLFTFVTILTRLDPWQQLMGYLWRRHANISRLLLLQMVALTAALFIITPVMQFIAQNIDLPALDKSLQFLKLHPWYYPWQLFTWTWWLTTIPISASLFAPIITGLSIRKSLFALLLLPFVLSLFELVYGLQNVVLLWQNNKEMLILMEFGKYFIFCIGALLIIGYFFFSANYKQQLLSATYKDTGLLKKHRLPLKVTNGILQITLVLVMFYLLGGLFLLSRFYFAVAATGVIVYGLIGIGLVRKLLEKPK
jgi:choline-glycine betaine transporter